MYKVIVAGGRDFANYELLEEKLNFYFSARKDIEIVSGLARGADQLAIRYAIEHKLPLAEFPADWGTFGKAAGYRRNEQMAIYADCLIAFWDGTSRGTMHMIDIMRKANKSLRIVKY